MGFVVLALCAVGLSDVGEAVAEDVVPESCKLHPTHVVGPGCVPSATSELREPSQSFPNVSPFVTQVAILDTWVENPETGFVENAGLQLHFDSWVRNLGTVPLELLADDPLDPTTVMQCMKWTSYVCREHQVVGEYAWHADHGHYHFQDFANYQLRRLGPDGRPDYSPAGLVSISEKVSFCLVDSTLLDVLKPSPPLYLSCGSARQGVSPGWADIYGMGTPGQHLPIEGVTDGRYALVVTMDYSNRLYETDDTDNVVEVTVEVSGNATQATLVGTHYPKPGT